MGAFILAGLVFFGTLIVCMLIIGNDMMSGSSASPAPIFYGGMIISALILASHWMPHIGW
jgi:hypothetical protein